MYFTTSSYHHHITCWIRYCPRRRSWPDFIWSLSLPRLAISFDHMHPLSPVHFSSSQSLLAFSTFASAFLFLYYHRLTPNFKAFTITFSSSFRKRSQKSFIYQGAKIWNSIPSEIRQLSFHKFKIERKQKLLESYC